MSLVNSSMRNTYAKGFTIVEMIVYIAVLALVLAGVINMVLAVSSTFGELRAARQLNRSAALVLDRFSREVRDANAVVLAGSVFDTHPGELVLDYGVGVPQVRFYLDGGTVKIDRGGSYEGDLTVPYVSTADFVFRRMAGDNSELVRLEMTMTSTSGKASKTETFYASSVVRGSYGQ